MKILKNIKWLLLIALAPVLASCSWEELPAYEDANIDNAAFYYRFYDPTAKDPITGEAMVRNVPLTTSASSDADAGTVSVSITVPETNFASFPGIYEQVSLSNLVGTITVSTAARVEVADNHKVLGVPDDWTEPHAVIVKAANGTTKKWTITVTSFTKQPAQ